MANRISRVLCLLMVLMFVSVAVTTLRAQQSAPEAKVEVVAEPLDQDRGIMGVFERTFSYDPPLFSPNEYVDAHDVSIAQATWTNEVGAPMLPAEYVSITLPPGALPVSVKVQRCEPVIIDLPKDITPVPERVPVSPEAYEELYGDQPQGAENFIFGEAYEKNAFYPSQDISFTTPYGISPYGEPSRNDIRLSTESRAQYVMAVLFPMQYNPVTNTALFYPELTLTIEYSEQPLFKTRAGNSTEHYDMVIITPRSYVPAFEELAGHRNSTGIITRVVALEDVYSGRFFTAEGVDNPEKIKRFLEDAIENWNITYVLLGGDSGQVPIRYTKVSSDSAFNNVPCDLYYADIFKSNGAFADWQVDNDGVWGEPDADLNDVDLLPDLVLGRLPASTLAEAQGMVAKIKYYDNNTYGADWFRNITLMGLDTFTGDGVAEGEYYSNFLINNQYTSARGWANHTLYDSNGKCSASQLLQTQNHHVGILTFSDHGLETGWAGRVDTGHVNSFTNTNKLPIVSVDACLCGAFDTGTCFGESFLKKGSNQGGICALASSRISLGVVGVNHVNAVSGFYNRVFHYSYTDDHVAHVGEMYSGAQILYYTYQSPKTQGSDYLMMNEYCFFGDPATFIGGFPTTHGTMSCDSASKSANPGQEVAYNISVNNTGDAPAQVEFVALKSDGGPVPPDWKVGLTQQAVEVPAHTNLTIVMNITVPSDADANEAFGVRVKALSFNLLECPLVVNTTTIAKTVYRFEFKCNDSDHTIDPEAETTFNLSITNQGNDWFYFDLSVIDPLADWQVSLSSLSAHIVRDQTAVVVLSLKPGPMVLSDTYHQSVTCSLRGWSGDSYTATVTASVKKSNGFNMTALEPGPKNVSAGQTCVFNLSLSNFGNHADAVELSVLNKGELPGWLISLDPSANVFLDPFSPGACAVNAVPPSDCLAGDYEIRVKASLYSDASTRTLTLVARVPAIYMFSLECLERDLGLGTQGQVPFDLSMSNSGNVQDTYDLKASAPEGWSLALDTPVALSAGGSQGIEAIATPPIGEYEAGVYNMSVEACSRGSGEKISLPLSIEVPVVYGLQAFMNTSTLQLWPGQTGNIAITVQNEGNAPETFSISHTTIISWNISSSSDKLLIPAFSENSATLSVTAPSSALSATYAIKLKVRSQSNSLLEKDLELTINVMQVYGMSLEVVVEKDTIKDEGNATFKFKLTNTGNGPDTFDITLDGVRSGWKADTPAQYDLGPAQSVTGVLTIDVPESKADKGVHDIHLFATSKGGDAENVTFYLEVKKTSIPPIGDIIGINNDGSDSFNMLYIIIPLLVLIIIVAVVIIALVARRRGKKTKPAPAPVKPQIHSKAPEYSAPSTTVEKGKVEMTPVYAVSPPPAQKAPPAKSTPPPPPEPAPEPEVSVAAEPVAPAPEMAASPELSPEPAPEPDVSLEPEPDMGLEWEE